MGKLMKLMLLGLTMAALPGFADASLCDSAPGNLVQNCGFETGDFTNWTVLNNDGFTMVTNILPGANSGNYYVALGTVGGDATIEQTIADTAGTEYTFSFFYGTNGTAPSDFTAMWDNQILLSLPNPAAQVYTQYSFGVTGTGSDTITFLARNDPSWSYLDDVSVLPEPSFFGEGGLLALVLLGIAGSRAFQKKRSLGL